MKSKTTLNLSPIMLILLLTGISALGQQVHDTGYYKLSISPNSNNSDSILISGIVYDIETKEVLPFACGSGVTDKNKIVVTISADYNGQFKFKVKKGAYSFHFSYPGYFEILINSINIEANKTYCFTVYLDAMPTETIHIREQSNLTDGQQPEYPDSGFTNKAEAKNLTVNGLKEGKWVESYTYADNGQSSFSLIIYKNGQPFGIVRIYESKSGKLIGEVPYTEGKINGVEKTYFVSGELQNEKHYSMGVENGIEKLYYKNGQIEYEEPYIDGKINGVIKWYYEDGKLAEELPYENNRANGIEKVYYENGRLKSERTAINGDEGVLKQYDENGNQIKQ